MEISPDLAEWDPSEDRELLKQFLETRTGKRLVPKLLESCPTLLAAGDSNAILIRSGELRGVQIILQALLSLVSVELPANSKDPASEYPRLDDDAAWADGKKVVT